MVKARGNHMFAWWPAIDEKTKQPNCVWCGFKPIAFNALRFILKRDRWMFVQFQLITNCATNFN
ncbi:hypothetical protein B9Q03_13135 [Candidatus Marsarchaeota G2 archaeon OSP_D]|uniref:Uncharacterized protein n=1 Tax=Candidatus Marsarchaeota G2 archaeon OSP_D TaxID=1978157 RepID=A0A2R6ADD7_9ARCH|nr:MAG: hypothetical protein B9Q03_13135 [Candidatus Marsarchaeota G2 archaeon OSP_D]